MEPKQKLGQNPAYPSKELKVVEKNGYGDVQEYKLVGHDGMTIRQKIGSDVLCALIGNISFESIPIKEVINMSLSITDTFLQKEAE